MNVSELTCNVNVTVEISEAIKILAETISLIPDSRAKERDALAQRLQQALIMKKGEKPC